MDARRTRQFLILAFAISLLIHIIVASGLRWPALIAEQDQVEIVHVEHMTRTTAVHLLVTPPPKTPAPQKTRAPRAVIAHPGKPIGTGKGAAGAGGTAGETPIPQPSPVAVSSAPPCSKGDIAVAVASSPDPPEIPAAARGAATNATARIRVTLDATGTVQKAIIVGSTGNASLDLTAVSMARSAQYAPALHECKPIAADYTFTVRFAPW